MILSDDFPPFGMDVSCSCSTGGGGGGGGGGETTLFPIVLVFRDFNLQLKKIEPAAIAVLSTMSRDAQAVLIVGNQGRPWTMRSIQHKAEIFFLLAQSPRRSTATSLAWSKVRPLYGHRLFGNKAT